jgi:hypothetical protein
LFPNPKFHQHDFLHQAAILQCDSHDTSIPGVPQMAYNALGRDKTMGAPVFKHSQLLCDSHYHLYIPVVSTPNFTYIFHQAAIAV